MVPVSMMATYLTLAALAAVPAEEVFTVLCKARGYRHARLVAELQTLAHNSSGLLPDPGRAWRLNWLTN